jgi:serine/threonine protein kinase
MHECVHGRTERLPGISYPSSNTVTKVIVKREVFEEEWRAARLLHEIDPTQHRLLYPFSACETTSMPLDALTYQNCNFPDTIRPKTVFLLEMPHGGRSLKQLARQGARLSQTHAEAIIEQIRMGLELLHHKSWVHGDLHAGNVLVSTEDATLPQAYLIDFAKMRRGSIQDEVKDFAQRIIMHAINDLVEGGRFECVDASGSPLKNVLVPTVGAVRYRFVSHDERMTAKSRTPPPVVRKVRFSEDAGTAKRQLFGGVCKK